MNKSVNYTTNRIDTFECEILNYLSSFCFYFFFSECVSSVFYLFLYDIRINGHGAVGGFFFCTKRKQKIKANERKFILISICKLTIGRWSACGAKLNTLWIF